MKEEYIGIILVVCAGLFMLLGMINKNNSFIDLNNVISSHLKLFKESKKQYLNFYLYPLIMSIGVAFLYCADGMMYQNIIVVVSIFVSMLLAILSILTTKDYSKHEGQQRERIKKVLKETNNAIVFCVFISILIIIISMIMLALDSAECDLVNKVISALVFYLMQVLMLNMLLIVKRMGKLI